MKLEIVTLIICCAMAAFNPLYDFFRPTEILETVVRVQSGDTMWDICNETYIAKDNAECFNSFYHANTKANGSDIQPGDLVIIRNEVYK